MLEGGRKCLWGWIEASAFEIDQILKKKSLNRELLENKQEAGSMWKHPGLDNMLNYS
jgi:hypothetical protein